MLLRTVNHGKPSISINGPSTTHGELLVITRGYIKMFEVWTCLKCIFGLLYYYIVVALLQEQRKVWSLWRDLCRCIWIYLDAFGTTLSPNVLFYGVIESQVNMDCGRKNNSTPPSLHPWQSIQNGRSIPDDGSTWACFWPWEAGHVFAWCAP
jgi:hypothetical protein